MIPHQLIAASFPRQKLRSSLEQYERNKDEDLLEKRGHRFNSFLCLLLKKFRRPSASSARPVGSCSCALLPSSHPSPLAQEHAQRSRRSAATPRACEQAAARRLLWFFFICFCGAAIFRATRKKVGSLPEIGRLYADVSERALHGGTGNHHDLQLLLLGGSSPDPDRR